MRGIEEAKKLYEEKGKGMIHSLFPEYEGQIAVGLAGHGSECFSFDDDISRDHDFESGFCLWVTDEDDVLIGPLATPPESKAIPVNSGGVISVKRSASPTPMNTNHR